MRNTKAMRLRKDHPLLGLEALMRSQLEQSLQLNRVIDEFGSFLGNRFQERLQRVIEHARDGLAALPEMLPQEEPVFPIRDPARRQLSPDAETLLAEVEEVVLSRVPIDRVLDRNDRWWRPIIRVEWELAEKPATERVREAA